MIPQRAATRMVVSSAEEATSRAGARRARATSATCSRCAATARRLEIELRDRPRPADAGARRGRRAGRGRGGALAALRVDALLRRTRTSGASCGPRSRLDDPSRSARSYRPRRRGRRTRRTRGRRRASAARSAPPGDLDARRGRRDRGRRARRRARGSARRAGRTTRSSALLAELGDADDRRARYVCEMVAIAPDGEEIVGEGRLEGRIARGAARHEGFGYDPIFVPGRRGADRRRARERVEVAAARTAPGRRPRSALRSPPVDLGAEDDHVRHHVEPDQEQRRAAERQGGRDVLGEAR